MIQKFIEFIQLLKLQDKIRTSVKENNFCCWHFEFREFKELQELYEMLLMEYKRLIQLGHLCDYFLKQIYSVYYYDQNYFSNLSYQTLQIQRIHQITISFGGVIILAILENFYLISSPIYNHCGHWGRCPPGSDFMDFLKIWV